MEINKDHLELRIDESWVPADEFSKVFKDFLGLVSEVADAVTRKKDAFDWQVAVEKGSNVIRLQPLPKNAPLEAIQNVLTSVDAGLEEIATKGTRPNYFNDKALRHVVGLSKHSRKNNQPTERITALGPQNQKRSFMDIERKVTAMLNKPTESWGSITGRLLVVSAKKGDSCTIDDELTGQPIKCSFTAELSQSVFKAFKHRVRVEGRIKFSGDGNPTSIRVDSDDHIKILKGQAELPSFKDVLGIHNRVG